MYNTAMNAANRNDITYESKLSETTIDVIKIERYRRSRWLVRAWARHTNLSQRQRWHHHWRWHQAEMRC